MKRNTYGYLPEIFIGISPHFQYIIFEYVSVGCKKCHRDQIYTCELIDLQKVQKSLGNVIIALQF